jgi:hypothetical protein
VLPFALSTTTAFGIFLAVLMVAGYVVIWALWHFVFSKAPPDDDRKRQELADRAKVSEFSSGARDEP